MHGNYTAVTAMQQADLLLALGSRFDDRVTGKVSAFAPGAKVVHVDIDKAEIGKVRRPEVAIHADCRLAIEALVESITASGPPDTGRLAPWIATLSKWQAQYPYTYDRSEPDRRAHGRSGRRPTLKPQYVIEQLRAATPDDTILVSGVGQHQMWASQHWSFEHPNTWINSGGLARWALPSQRRSEPRWAGPTAWCGPSTGTAVSR